MNRVAYYRRMQSLTQKQLADMIGVSSSAIAMYETHRRLPNVVFAKRMASVLKVNISALYPDDDFSISK